MPYIDQAYIEDRMDPKELARTTAPGGSPHADVDTTMLADAIADAETVVNSYLAGRYTVPFADGEVPEMVQIHTFNITVHNLYSIKGENGVPNGVQSRYKATRDQLESIQAGKGIIPGAVEAVSYTPVYSNSPSTGKKYSRAKMEGVFYG